MLHLRQRAQPSKRRPAPDRQGAYKSGKLKFPDLSMFSRPSKQSFPDKYKVKTRCDKSH